MFEKAMLMALVAAAVLFGATRLGGEVKQSFCQVAAAFDGGQCKQ